jgi:hypothetical protein
MLGLTLSDRLGDWNPQLLREIQGRCKPRNLVFVGAIATFGQLLLMISRWSALPAPISAYNPSQGLTNQYCLGSPPPEWSGYDRPNAYIPDNWCLQDFHGNWILNWQLWWLDCFTIISYLGIAIAVAGGCYLLIADLFKEQQRGTLNFLRLSPQSAREILLGKAIGVPILLFGGLALWLPLHLIAGLGASIPLKLILGFYCVTIAGLGFFYSLALSIGLKKWQLGLLQPFLLFYGILSFGLPVMVMVGSRQFIFHTPGDWLFLFYPGSFLSYLQDSTLIPTPRQGTLSTLNDLRWYGTSLFRSPLAGMACGIAHYGLWTYWIGEMARRRFHQPHAPLLSKSQGYWMTLAVASIALGFALQTSETFQLAINYKILQLISTIWGIFSILALTPNRSTLQDWSRYRHRQPHKSPIQDLALGARSPAIFAIALNCLIFLVFILPSIGMAPLEREREALLGSFTLTLLAILFYGVVYQRIALLPRLQLRRLALTLAIITFVVFPFSLAVILHRTPLSAFLFSLFPFSTSSHLSILPFLSVAFGQAIATVVVAIEMNYRLRKLGESSTKILLSGNRGASLARADQGIEG